MTLLRILIGFLIEKAYAQNAWQLYCSQLGGYCGSGRAFIIQLATRVEQMVVQFIGGAAVLAVIYGGIRIITSGGDDSKRDEGKKIIEIALIGLVLAILAHSLVLFVAGFVSGAVG
jgi:hypothetical protein